MTLHFWIYTKKKQESTIDYCISLTNRYGRSSSGLYDTVVRWDVCVSGSTQPASATGSSNNSTDPMNNKLDRRGVWNNSFLTGYRTDLFCEQEELVVVVVVQELIVSWSLWYVERGDGPPLLMKARLFFSRSL